MRLSSFSIRPSHPPSLTHLSHPSRSTLTAENTLEVLGDLLRNPVNEALVVKVAQQFSEALTPEGLIKLFEAAKVRQLLGQLRGGGIW